jgi:hypothetical protein
VAAPFLLIVLMTGAVQAQTTPPPDTTDGDGPPPFSTQPATQTAAGPIPAMPPDPIPHPVVRPFEMPSSYQPSSPIAYSPAPAVAATAAVPVEKYRGEYEAPADEQQRYYLMGVQGKFETEQSMMGALDGEWTVMAPAGGPLFTMVIDDAGGGTPVDGAWRDIRAGHGSSMGVIDSIDRGARTLKISFHSGGGDRLEPTVLTLTAQPDGRWSGEMNDAGATQPVVMNHAPIVPTQP